MRKRTLIILVIAVVMLAVWTARVYAVNQGVAKEYDIDMYQIGDVITLDDATFKVKDVAYGNIEEEYGFKWIPVSIDMEVQNKTSDDISITDILTLTLAYGMYTLQTREGDVDVDQLRHLPPGETSEFTLDFNVRKEYTDEDGKIYIDRSLYEKKVIEKYDEGKRYGIAVDLS